ncbi:MAG: redoxin domain-containing protein [Saprospiraceae bacterium]|nr:redoxin domain-containing protein [Saprospiraceae bacterium]
MKVFNWVIFIILAGLMYFIYQFMYMKPAFMVGEKVPDFRTTTIDGKKFSIRDMEGKLVLLDFWATWCGPCRKQLPALSSLYRTYKDSLHGVFEIVSVALDDDTTALRLVINQDSLVWPYHIREPKSGGEIAALYQIKKIPTSYLLNDEGQILKVNPGIDDIKEWLVRIDAVHNQNRRKTSPMN